MAAARPDLGLRSRAVARSCRRRMGRNPSCPASRASRGLTSCRRSGHRPRCRSRSPSVKVRAEAGSRRGRRGGRGRSGRAAEGDLGLEIPVLPAYRGHHSGRSLCRNDRRFVRGPGHRCGTGAADASGACQPWRRPDRAAAGQRRRLDPPLWRTFRSLRRPCWRRPCWKCPSPRLPPRPRHPRPPRPSRPVRPRARKAKVVAAVASLDEGSEAPPDEADATPVEAKPARRRATSRAKAPPAEAALETVAPVAEPAPVPSACR